MNLARLNLLLTAALAVVVVLLGSITYVSWHSNRQQQIANQDVRYTYELIAQIEQLATQSRDAYTDARNYDLSGNVQLLDNFQQIKRQLPYQLQQLETALAAHPAELHELHQLGHLINQRMQLAQRLLDQRGQPLQARYQEPLLAQARQLLSQIRPRVVALTRREQAFVQWRQRRAEQAYQRTQQWIAVSTGAALLVISLVFWLLRKQLIRRMVNEIRLQQYEADLQNQLRQQQVQNQELDRLNQQLAHSNEGLQQFAYVASHDLQEPLRKIQSFSSLLRNQLLVNSSEIGIDYLNRIESAASRMSTLIRDLLAFSRISTHQAAKSQINLSEVIQAALQDLDLIIDETGAQLTIGPLPTILGDKLQLEQLFKNLISNALKFRRSDPLGQLVPLVQITSQSVLAVNLPANVQPTQVAAYYYRIDVIDNGIGFDEKYLDRIFHVFQRLHGKHKFAGTGIGLAICEKVVTNHGGAITASSQVGQGSTFHIYLPL